MIQIIFEYRGMVCFSMGVVVGSISFAVVQLLVADYQQMKMRETK
jgi:hypothetical protein